MARKRTPGDSEKRASDDYWAEERKKLKYGEKEPEQGIEETLDPFGLEEQEKAFGKSVQKTMRERFPEAMKGQPESDTYMVPSIAGTISKAPKLAKYNLKKIRERFGKTAAEEAPRVYREIGEEFPDATSDQKLKKLDRFFRGEGTHRLKYGKEGSPEADEILPEKISEAGFLRPKKVKDVAEPDWRPIEDGDDVLKMAKEAREARKAREGRLKKIRTGSSGKAKKK